MVAKLQKENGELRGQLAAAPKATARSGKINGTEAEELLRILSNVEVAIPENLRKEEDAVKQSLLDIFILNADSLVSGVTNRYDSSDAETFFYFNVSPKLAVHDLVTNEKVPGVKYRRSFVNDRGRALLAEIAKRRAAANSKKNAVPAPQPKD